MQHTTGRHLVTSPKAQVSGFSPCLATKANCITRSCFPLDGTKIFHGAEVTLFKAIAKHLNFDYTIREPQVCCGFGTFSTGMMGEMTLGRSDVGWSQLYLNEFKSLVMDVTTSYDEDQACFMVN